MIRLFKAIRFTTVLPLLTVLILLSCADENIIPKVQEDTFSEIQSRYQKIDPTKIDYLFNAKRAKMMQEQVKNTAYPAKLNVQLLLIKELLRSNQIEQAINVTEDVKLNLIKLAIELPPQIQQKFLLLEATIYLRQGELQNCIENHNSTSCIIPFTAEAQHINKTGSEKAIPILLKVLDIDPSNTEAIWLLSIAYQTLGVDKIQQKIPKAINFPVIDEKSRWNNIAGQLGVDFNGLAGGVVADDFNNDGLIDIICSAWGENDHLTFYANMGEDGFIDQTKQSGLDLIFGGLNINHTDYNNDGFLDIFVMRGGWFETQGKLPNSLLKNNGDGTFTDITKQVGIYTLAPTQSSVWTDINQDGFLDLFVTNESSKHDSFSNELWINNGDETFTNRIEQSGLDVKGFFKGSTAICLDKNSTKPSLFLSDFRGGNRLFENKCTIDKILFEEVTETWNIEGPEASFSCWAFDHNNDGNEDIFVSAYGKTDGSINPSSAAGANYQDQNIGASPIIYQNQGQSMINLDARNGLDKAVYTMGSNFGDLENDGDLDFYLATGDPAISSIVPNVVYQNTKIDGKPYFDEISFQTGMAHLQKGHGVAFADFDQDGNQDIYTVLGGAYEGDYFQNAFFKNPGSENDWIVLDLQGIKSNHSAMGARVALQLIDSEGNHRSIHRKVSSGSSFGGNSLRLEIGLGKVKSIESCQIIWPFPNSYSNLKNLKINRAYKIVEGKEATPFQYKSFEFPMKDHMHHHHE